MFEKELKKTVLMEQRFKNHDLKFKIRLGKFNKIARLLMLSKISLLFRNNGRNSHK